MSTEVRTEAKIVVIWPDAPDLKTALEEMSSSLGALRESRQRLAAAQAEVDTLRQQARAAKSKVDRLMADELSGPARLAGPLHDVMVAVANKWGITVEDMLAKDRRTRTAEARQVAMYFCRRLTSACIMEVARAFQRDHGVIPYSVAVVTERRKHEPQFNHTLKELEMSLKP